MDGNPFGLVSTADGGTEHMDEEEPSEAMDAEDGEDEDEGDKAAARSALTDFAAAIGVRIKDPDKALEAFQELMEHC